MDNHLPRTCGNAPEAREGDARSLRRFFCAGDLSPGATRELPEAAAHHAARVLRLALGDPVVVFNGAGGESDARIVSIGKDHVAVRVGPWRAREAEPLVRVTLLQGLSARERMDFTLQKAVELGVADIFPVETRRSVMRLAEERAARRVEHWQNLVVAACEQCGRNRVPAVYPVSTLPDWLGAHREPSGEHRIILSLLATTRLRDLAAPQQLLLLAGPEGGFAPEEVDMARSCGFTPVRLGPRVLRTETAALAALAAVHALWGDL
ncbi:MAG TPA: 16S rRNA (uracil(1498)-N(3))-methyltransferase [Burkholderiales bacterium]|nr:16S rRNA (uracil(1498)-N(3))-methyltransferase [Burkholderiales bacterium]